jgi:hypothetical protein
MNPNVSQGIHIDPALQVVSSTLVAGTKKRKSKGDVSTGGGAEGKRVTRRNAGVGSSAEPSRGEEENLRKYDGGDGQVRL